MHVKNPSTLGTAYPAKHQAKPSTLKCFRWQQFHHNFSFFAPVIPEIVQFAHGADYVDVYAECCVGHGVTRTLHIIMLQHILCITNTRIAKKFKLITANCVCSSCDVMCQYMSPPKKKMEWNEPEKRRSVTVKWFLHFLKLISEKNETRYEKLSSFVIFSTFLSLTPPHEFDFYDFFLQDFY